MPKKKTKKRTPPRPDGQTSSLPAAALRERISYGRMSDYEIAPLIGVHHDDLDGEFRPERHTIAALIALSRHTDLHPADIVADLGPLMSLTRLEPDALPGIGFPDGLEHDATVLASALTLARGPLSAGALADALGWDAERTTAAVEFITDNPELTGPLALRRLPNDALTLTPRLDLIGTATRQALDDAADLDAHTFTPRQIALLLGLLRSGGHADLRRFSEAEYKRLIDLGVLHRPTPDQPGRLEVHPDVAFSLADPGR